MKTYIVKYRDPDKEQIIQLINSYGGTVEYMSPVLPILYANVNEEVKAKLEETFNLYYITEEVEGSLQEVEGSLASLNLPNISMTPAVSTQPLRNLQAMGWGVTIAVLDSGVNEDWISEKYDFTGYGVVPEISHGTTVASIIKHYSPGSIINSYKICQTEKIKSGDLLMALDAAVSKSDVINMSLGFTIPTCTKDNPCHICETVNFYAENAGKVFVSAAGNIGLEHSIQCPGNAVESITVGAIDATNTSQLADYSSKGTPGIKKPNILTSGMVKYNNDFFATGTSFATPLISGVIGAIFPMLNKNSSITKSYLYSTSTDLGMPEHHQGFGLLNLYKLVEVLRNEQSNIKGQGQKTN
ncbi:S8 family serine peptidase [Rummeliibacillus sp. POC4]|uniref:S8 family serine peptidase n=1 Tax=Rummeliibacillus sp. POC4 TaxID=2305899 RepID=UPI000E66C3DF|nr:S8 family serine peptidase [Rummeliibacillus sp. POC4]RIJ64067.1 hypothetical protein D1606_12000 [Rummeliibacillus sp. POC4]